MLSGQVSPFEFEKEMPSFMEKIKEELTFPLAWDNYPADNYEEWRNIARKQVLQCMLPPPPKADDPKVEIVAIEKRDGYEARKIRFNITGYSRIEAYLLVPDGKGPFPGVVLLHDHGAHFSIGKEKVVKPFGVDTLRQNDADDWAIKCYDSQYPGDFLASQGYAVIAIDALFWGDRGRKEGIDYNAQQAVACNFELLGRSWSAFITYEDIYTAEFMAGLDEVDENRIACLGFSMGSYRSWMLAALSDRIKAGAAICWMDIMEQQMSQSNKRNKGGSAFSMLIPGLRNYLDYPHIASIACPKAMLFFNGSKDKLFPPEGVLSAYEEMQKVWQSQSAGSKLITKMWDVPHVFNKEMQKEVVDFFNKELQ